jgi:2-amino-4-hydroxy-6-hydroxymethyldihydropteridine diphosphokinase
MMVAYLALGSNLGHRSALISQAVVGLSDAGVAIEACSPLYETDAVTPDPQPRYLNGAVRVATPLSARALLNVCLGIERALGRSRPPGRVSAAREIDIDLLLYGDAVIAEPPDLIVPHPRLLDRPFVRIPLADVAQPGLLHPITGERLDAAAPDPSVRRELET